MASIDDSPEPRYFGIHEGVVTQNVDPRGLGRIRVRVPGITDDAGSAWALPVSVGGGTHGRGIWDIPDVGAEAYVFFLGGDPDKPRYLAGHWGAPKGQTEVPRAVREAIEQDGVAAQTKVKVWETAAFELVLDERAGKERAYLRAKDRGEALDGGSALMIELDHASGTLTLSGTVAIVLRTLGLFDVKSLVAQVNGRKIVAGTDKAI